MKLQHFLTIYIISLISVISRFNDDSPVDIPQDQPADQKDSTISAFEEMSVSGGAVGKFKKKDKKKKKKAQF